MQDPGCEPRYLKVILPLAAQPITEVAIFLNDVRSLKQHC
jgi:hypothetical protein